MLHPNIASITMAATESLFFTMLPGEIRNEIYHSLFDTDKGAPVKITSLSKWMSHDRVRRRHTTSYTVNALPTCPLFDFMINRQFFNEASAAWLRHHSIECQYDDMDIIKTSPIFKYNLTRFKCVWRGSFFDPFGALRECMSLRHLRLQVEDSVFDTIENKMCVLHTYSPPDYLSIQQLVQIFRIPNLERVELIPMKSELAKTPLERMTWRNNVCGLESFLQNSLKSAMETKKERARRKEALNARKMQSPFSLLQFLVYWFDSSWASFEGFFNPNATQQLLYAKPSTLDEFNKITLKSGSASNFESGLMRAIFSTEPLHVRFSSVDPMPLLVVAVAWFLMSLMALILVEARADNAVDDRQCTR